MLGSRSASTGPQRSTLHGTLRWPIAMLRMSRPLQLAAISLVYAFGSLLAVHRGAEMRPGNFSWGFLAIMSGAISIHLANEYADYETDRRTRRTLFSGGSGALPEMGLKRGGALVLAWVWLVIALLVAAAGLIGGFLRIAPLIILGLGVFLGWMYSLSPFKLAWRGWGEALNAFLGGMLLPLYGAAVISGHIDGSIPIVTVPFALLTFNNLLATTYADRRSDHAAGKYTLATRMRRGQLRLVYASTSILAFVVLLGMPAKLLPDIAKTISLSAIPMVIWGWLTYTRIHNPLPSVSAMTVLLLAQISGFLLDINPSAAF